MSNERNDMKYLNIASNDIVVGRATVPATSRMGRVGWALVGGGFTESERVAMRHAAEINRLMSLCEKTPYSPANIPAFVQ